MKESVATIVVILVLILAAGGAWWYFKSQQASPAGATVMDEFPGKVVYTTDTSQDTSVFEADCRERGGAFNACGTICAPDAEICAQVCAFTCEWETETDTPLGKPSTWETYANPDLGFSINHPEEMEVTEEGDDTVITSTTFSLAGAATATDATADRITITITKDTHTEESLEAFAQQQATSTPDSATIASPVEPISLNRRDGFTYALDEDGGKQVYVFLPAGENTVFRLIYRVNDQDDVGYQSVVDGMLDTLEIFSKL